MLARWSMSGPGYNFSALSSGGKPVSPIPSIHVTVLPDDCDSYGHVNQAAFLRMFERVRWEGLQTGPGTDVFERQGAWPAARKATIEYHGQAHPGDSLRIDTTLTQVGRTSFTLHQVARKTKSRALVAEVHTVFVCIDRGGDPVAVPDELREFYGTRPSADAGVQHMMVRDQPTPVDVQGDGSPILFIHGFPLDRTMWRRLMSPLTGWKRIAPDLRGFGMNEALSDPPTIASYGDDLVTLLNQMGEEPAVICGLSMGGYIAFDLVRRFPERVRALILANTRAASDDDATREGRDATARLVKNDGLDALVGVLLPKILAPESHSTQPQVVDHVRTMIKSASIPGVVAALAAMRDRPDSTALLSEIQVPTLVVSGRQDAIIPAAESKQMAEAIPNAHYTVIPDAGHLTPVEQPIATGRVVGEFLEAIA